MWVVSRGGLSLACVVIVLAIVTVSRGPTVTALLTRRKIKDQNQVDADVVSAIDMQVRLQAKPKLPPVSVRRYFQEYSTDTNLCPGAPLAIA